MSATTEKTGKQKLRTAVRDMPGASTAELALAAGIGRPTASTLLNKWAVEGKVRQEKIGRAVSWYDIDTIAAMAGAMVARSAGARFTAEEVDAALDTLAEEITATQVPGLHDGAHKVPGAAAACHCGDDQVGHVVHPAAAPAAKDARGSVEKARTAALAALGRAGAEGMKVSAVWAVMQTEGGIVWVGAYRLLNRMRRENGVIVTGEHKAENRTARLAPR